MKWDFSSNVLFEDIFEDILILGECRLNNFERDVSCVFGR